MKNMTISLLYGDSFKIDKRGKIYFTYSDLKNLPQWPETPMIELLGGELYMVPSPTLFHQDISLNLALILKTYLKANSMGKLWIAPVDVIMSEKNVFIPDLVFVSNERTDIITDKNIVGVPDLIIEILSSNRDLDLIDKKKKYEDYGVKEYWIIDPESLKVYINQLVKSKFEEKEYKTGYFRSRILKNLKISLEKIFEKQ